MGNFPIYNKEYKLKQEELLRYLDAFPEHNLESISIQDHVLFSEHLYDDGLRIKVQWLIPENEKNDLHINSPQKLLFLWKQESLTPAFCRILNHSRKVKKKRTPPKVLRETFVCEVLNQDPKRLTEVEYRELEFPTKEKTSLSDSYFEELQTHIANNILFEQYCNEKTAQSR